MVLIHERLYQSRDFARIDFAEYVHGLTNHLFSLFHIGPETVKLSIDIKDISLDLSTAIPCGLIVNEIVSNSLKHAFPDGRTGRIKIVMKPFKKNEIELTASDNGIGIPDEVDIRETESLGLHLVSILAEDQLRGTIKLDKTKGTRFEIKFKAKQ
jgi:two-component sensor histidine kinase